MHLTAKRVLFPWKICRLLSLKSASVCKRLRKRLPKPLLPKAMLSWLKTPSVKVW
jgi:hypothetical protein